MRLETTLDMTSYWLQGLLATESEIEHTAMSAENWVASEELAKEMDAAALRSVGRATRLRHIVRTLGINESELPSVASHPVSASSQVVSIDSEDMAMDLAAVSHIRRLLGSAAQLYSDVATHTGTWSLDHICAAASQIADEVDEEFQMLGQISRTIGEAFRSESDGEGRPTAFGSMG
ncbi:MAG: hypothetical protein AAGF47_01330 [Planctomycetota bacterium]